MNGVYEEIRSRVTEAELQRWDAEYSTAMTERGDALKIFEVREQIL